MTLLDDNRLFTAEPKARGLAQALYAGIKDLPLVSPHGHTEPRWYAENEKFPDPAQLLIVPDHYVFRMLFSRGIRLEDLGVPTTDGSAVETDGRKIWKLSPMDVKSFTRWDAYTRARDLMFAATDSPWAPWIVAPSEDKKRVRLNVISHVLKHVPYKDLPREEVKLPRRGKIGKYKSPDYPIHYIEEKF